MYVTGWTTCKLIYVVAVLGSASPRFQQMLQSVTILKLFVNRPQFIRSERQDIGNLSHSRPGHLFLIIISHSLIHLCSLTEDAADCFATSSESARLVALINLYTLTLWRPVPAPGIFDRSTKSGTSNSDLWMHCVWWLLLQNLSSHTVLVSDMGPVQDINSGAAKVSYRNAA